MYNKSNISQIDRRPNGGSTILVRKIIPHERLPLNIELQATAIRATLHQTITICSICIPPNHWLKKSEMENLIEQLPTPFLILGDFNAHRNLWGNIQRNDKGKTIENILETTDICILNDGQQTYLHPATGTTSAIDLSFCSATIFMDFKWEVHDDQCGSDHYPIFVKTNKIISEERAPKWQINRADWSTYTKLCETQINNKILEETDPVSTFTKLIIKIAEQAVPKSTTNKH